MTKHPLRRSVAATPIIAARRKAGKETFVRIRRLSVLSVMAALSAIALLGLRPSQASEPAFKLISTIAFTSNRDQPPQQEVIPPVDIYLMDPDGTNVRRLTFTAGEDNAFPVLSPDGKKIVFESNRNKLPAEPRNTSDLFVMNADGSELSALTRGASAGWSPDSKYIVFHASKSGTGLPINNGAGAATTDSDIFVLNVDDCLKAIQLASQDPTKGDCRTTAPGLLKNITNNGDVTIDDDPDWAPAGTPNGKEIVFTSRRTGDALELTEMYRINADGSGTRQQLTTNTLRESAPDWSPDGTRIAFSCQGVGTGVGPDLEICVMNADGTGQVQLTNNAVFDVRPQWSPDGQQILFGRPAKPVGVPGAPAQQLFVMNADGTGVTQLTNANPGNPPVVTALASWGVIRVKGTVAAGAVAAATGPVRAP